MQRRKRNNRFLGNAPEENFVQVAVVPIINRKEFRERRGDSCLF
jgi:hypothetical protein